MSAARDLAVAAVDEWVLIHARPDRIELTQGSMLNLANVIEKAIVKSQARLSAQRDELVAALEAALPGLQDLVNQQCADESVYERDLSTLRMAKAALARAKGDQSLDLDEDGYPTGLPHCNPMGCT